MNSIGIIVAVALVFLFANSRAFANGGAWQTGVPVTGNAAASDQKKSTNVTIEDEKLVIDLHQEFAAVEVRYRMKNTGAEVAQDFFFPVERWAPSDGEDAGTAQTDLEAYSISADGAELKRAGLEQGRAARSQCRPAGQQRRVVSAHAGQARCARLPPFNRESGGAAGD